MNPNVNYCIFIAEAESSEKSTEEIFLQGHYISTLSEERNIKLVNIKIHGQERHLFQRHDRL